MTFRPRRSVLYMPGSNARAIEKARTLPVDGVILDLEDAVAPEAKEQARRQVAEAVKAGGFGGREVFIRVNGIDSPWHAEDLTAAAHAGPEGAVSVVQSLRKAHGTLACWYVCNLIARVPRQEMQGVDARGLPRGLPGDLQ